METTFISNIDKSDMYVLLVAAKATNTKIKINKNATKFGGVPLKDVVAVHTLDVKQDHSDMWVKYHEMKNDYHARKILCTDYLRPRYERF